MSVTYSMDYDSAKKLEETIQQYQKGAEEKINRYLHGKGYEMFNKAIHNAMPESGRSWKGKKASAKSANSLQDKDKSENLAVTIRAKTAYGYLYFPDDGSNTVKHAGNEQFMKRGAENATDRIVDICLGKLM